MEQRDSLDLEHASARDWVRAEYLRRRRVNAGYSLRAFARQLRISSGSLSEILAGKRPITERLGQRLGERLALKPDDTERFFELVRLDQAGRRQPKPQTNGRAPSYETIDRDRFHLIADWHHFALLSLMETHDFRSDIGWIAARLGITALEVRMALERLVRLGYVKIGEDGELSLLPVQLTTDDVPSTALRKSHTQSLQQAIAALDDVDPCERDITSMTIAVNKDRLPIAKEMIRIFRRSLTEFLETGRQDEVFNLNIQLVPVTRRPS